MLCLKKKNLASAGSKKAVCNLCTCALYISNQLELTAPVFPFKNTAQIKVKWRTKREKFKTVFQHLKCETTATARIMCRFNCAGSVLWVWNEAKTMTLNCVYGPENSRNYILFCVGSQVWRKMSWKYSVKRYRNISPNTEPNSTGWFHDNEQGVFPYLSACPR